MRMTDLNSFVRVSVITKEGKLIHLDLVTDGKDKFCDHFTSTREMENFMADNTEEALRMSVRKLSDTNYLLNCETKEQGLIISGDKWEKLQGKMINTFLPIIRKFMVNAISGNLYVVEDGKLVKQ